MSARVKRPKVQVGDFVVYENGLFTHVDEVWAKELNGVDAEAHDIVAIYRTPMWVRQ